MKTSIAETVVARLVETGGRTSQELGLGRIVGQVLIYLYMSDGDCSLDRISQDLELSKASASIAARQLEKLGMLKRSWKKGDRKSYYRTVENIETALRNGLVSFIRQRILAVRLELDLANEQLFPASGSSGEIYDKSTAFVQRRVKRAKSLCDSVSKLLDSPLVKPFI